MPSARIHEAVAREFNKDYGMNDLLLRIGSVSADSWRNVETDSGVKDKYLTHFWDFRIKDGEANDYAEFYLKYYNHLSNPFYFGYLLHLITDQYWKTYVDPRYEMIEKGVKGFRLKNGEFHDDKNWFGYFDELKLQRLLAKTYNLDYLPTKKEDIDGFCCEIDELNLSGLFGESGTLNYINTELTPKEETEESEIYDLNEIIKSIQEVVTFIKRELNRLEQFKLDYDNRYKIAVDIDDTILSTEELEAYYWAIYLKENPNIDANKEYKWGDPEVADFWSQYREKMAFGKVKDGVSKAFNLLKGKGYIVDLLSARPLEKYASLKKRMVEHFENNGVAYDHLNLGFYSKAKFLKEHGYDLLIDNDIENVREANSVGIDTILFGPYNPNYSGYQTDKWDDIPALIDTIRNEKKNNKIYD